MADDLRTALDTCWGDDPAGGGQVVCRWCGRTRVDGHAPGGPCAHLDLALRQRDALADFVRAEKRMVIMQGAFRLAKKSDKADVKRRLDEAALQLESRLRRLQELGIEEMVR